MGIGIKMSGGGEDVKAEVTYQTILINQILDYLNGTVEPTIEGTALTTENDIYLTVKEVNNGIK